MKISQLEIQLETFEKEKIQLQKKLDDSEKVKNKLSQINGNVIASVKSGLLVSAQIKLDLNDASLDCERSKYIVSTSNEVSLEAESYDEGESITSVVVVAKEIVCKAGLYFVRCLVFDSEGRSKEIVSNGVRTRGVSVSFSFEGCKRTVSLLRAQYKLEVWGAKGGLGGYSKGVLNLKDN